MGREYPSDSIQKHFTCEEYAWVMALTLNRPDAAERVLRNELGILLAYQEKKRVEDSSFTVHKGGPLHNIGISLAMQNRGPESVTYILAAYMEDIFTCETLEVARNAPAYKFLNGFSQLRSIIENVTEHAVQLKERGNLPADPLQEIIPTIEGQPIDLRTLPEIIDNSLRGTQQNRIFIGGDYSLRVILNEIKQIILGLNNELEPIIVDECDEINALVNDERLKSFLILDQCERAIIDVSHPRGQYMEIEHVLSMLPEVQTDMLVVSQSESSVSSLLRICNPKIYSSMEELGEMIREWLLTNNGQEEI